MTQAHGYFRSWWSETMFKKGDRVVIIGSTQNPKRQMLNNISAMNKLKGQTGILLDPNNGNVILDNPSILKSLLVDEVIVLGCLDGSGALDIGRIIVDSDEIELDDGTVIG